MKKNDEPVVVEQTFSTDIDTVWKSITKIDLIRQWYFNTILSFKPEVGFETQFSVESGGRSFLHLWKVTEVVPLKRIVYNWKYDGITGDSFVVFELFRQNDMTTLRLTHQIKESFPDNIPEFSRESCVEGWTFFIRKSLREFLEKTGKSSSERQL
jgi:uncharacterized protein YndB with AHSA1/START domain